MRPPLPLLLGARPARADIAAPDPAVPMPPPRGTVAADLPPPEAPPGPPVGLLAAASVGLGLVLLGAIALRRGRGGRKGPPPSG